jgi:hypothetical protein
MKKLPITLILLIVSLKANAIDYSHCVKSLESSIKERNISNSSNEYLNTIFSQECETSGSWKSRNAGVGLDAIVESIPIGFKGSYGANEQAMRNFCKTYSSKTIQKDTESIYTERVIGKALDTFDQCVRFTTQGISVNHKFISLDTLSVEITAGVGKPVEIQSVALSKNLICKGLDPITKKLISYNEETNVITNDTLGFTCTRSAKTGTNNSKIYEEATLVMPIRNFGSYDIYFPQDTKLSQNQASVLTSQINSLNQSLTQKINKEDIEIDAARSICYSGISKPSSHGIIVIPMQNRKNLDEVCHTINPQWYGFGIAKGTFHSQGCTVPLRNDSDNRNYTSFVSKQDFNNQALTTFSNCGSQNSYVCCTAGNQ